MSSMSSREEWQSHKAKGVVSGRSSELGPLMHSVSLLAGEHADTTPHRVLVRPFARGRLWFSSVSILLKLGCTLNAPPIPPKYCQSYHH